VDTELTRQGILEALLFVAEEPLPLARLQEVLADPDPSATQEALRELELRLEQEGRGLMVQEVAGGFRLTTRPEADPWVQKLVEVRPARLSRPALETLAIIAYRQPITRAEVEQVRGVAVDGVLRTLLERDLIRILGRKADAGRPIVYGTSSTFLEHFGFKDLGDLPTLKEIDELLGPAGAEAGGAGTVVPGPAAVATQSEDARLDTLAGDPADAAGADGEPATAEPGAGGGTRSAELEPASASPVADARDEARRGAAETVGEASDRAAGQPTLAPSTESGAESGPEGGAPAALAPSPEPGDGRPESGTAAGSAARNPEAGPES